MQELRGRFQFTGQHEHESQRQIRYRLSVASRGIDQRHAICSAGGCIDVNRIAPAGGHQVQAWQPGQGIHIHYIHLGDQHMFVLQRTHQCITDKNIVGLAVILIRYLTQSAQAGQGRLVHGSSHQHAGTKSRFSPLQYLHLGTAHAPEQDARGGCIYLRVRCA